MRYPRAALETSQPWRGSYRNTGECKHENADHLMAGERWALVDDPVSEFGQRVTQCEQLRCLDCGDWLSLGVSNDTATDVDIEIRAAELAGDPNRLSHSRDFDIIEHHGWREQESIDDLHVVDCNGDLRIDHNVPLNLDSPQWRAGYLARQIDGHRDPELTHDQDPK